MQEEADAPEEEAVSERRSKKSYTYTTLAAPTPAHPKSDARGLLLVLPRYRRPLVPWLRPPGGEKMRRKKSNLFLSFVSAFQQVRGAASSGRILSLVCFLYYFFAGRG
jgi:hypothetical protein